MKISLKQNSFTKKEINKELTIVIPAYNEEHGIRGTILECVKYNPDAIIMVIDDCSKDKTSLIVKGMQKKYSQIILIKNKKNLNYGGALKVGFKNFKTKYMVFIDADITYPPKYIPKLLQVMKKGNLDVVWGSRFSSTQKSHMPLIRKIGNTLLKGLFMIWTGHYISDVCSGMRIFTRKSIDSIDYDSLPNGLDMISAMSKRIIKRKLKYGIIPIPYAMREGHSKLNLINDFILMSRNIIREK